MKHRVLHLVGEELGDMSGYKVIDIAKKEQRQREHHRQDAEHKTENGKFPVDDPVVQAVRAQQRQVLAGLLHQRVEGRLLLVLEMPEVGDNGHRRILLIGQIVGFQLLAAQIGLAHHMGKGLYLIVILRNVNVWGDLLHASARLLISGPFNIQFLAKNREVKVIECNLRASRSFPFVSKILKRNFIETATKIMLDAPYQKPDKSEFDIDRIGVKASQFSFARLQNADPVLGVDMSSTGEVGCLGDDLNEALLNSLIATGYSIPKEAVLISSGGAKGKVSLLEPAQQLAKKGYTIYATAGTAKFFNDNGVKAIAVAWPDEDGNNNVMDLISQHKVGLVINVPKNHTSRELTNGYKIRRGAIDHNIPLMTNVRLAKAFIEAFTAMNLEDVKIKSWQEYNN